MPCESPINVARVKWSLKGESLTLSEELTLRDLGNITGRYMR